MHISFPSCDFIDPPNVIKVPITLQRQAAQYAVFKCQITSFPAPVVQWTRTGSVDPITDRRGKFEIKTTLDDSSITGPYSVETQLVIFNLSFTDQQTYTCAGISQVNVQNFINARSNASASLFVNGEIINFIMDRLKFLILSFQ